MPRLTLPQKRFCEAIVHHGLSPRRAYADAGFKPPAASTDDENDAARALLTLPAIQTYLLELRATEKAVATRQEVLAYLTRAVRCSVSDLEEGDPLIQEYSSETVKKGTPGEITRTKVKSLCKLTAVKQLMQMLGEDKPAKSPTNAGEDSDDDTLTPVQKWQRVLGDFLGPQPILPTAEQREEF